MPQTATKQSLLTKATALIARIGADRNDDDDMRLRKFLFVVAVLFLAIPPGMLEGFISFSFGEALAGSLHLGFVALSLLIVTGFGLTHRYYNFFLFCELSLVLIQPFLVTAVLGGFANWSITNIAWSFMCPLGALVMTDLKYARRWFITYLSLIGVLLVLQPYLHTTNNFPPAIAVTLVVANLGGTSMVTFILLSYFVGQRNLFQEKAEGLLLNILPKEIAAILKNENRIIADHFDGVSILFADVVNFTPLSAKMTPTELVELLNEVFSHFDDLAEKYGVEKIKTIGDCYMVAAGVPRPRLDHAQTLTQLALDIRDYVSQREFWGQRLVFRIGLNSGPVVAGVIGRKKFIYDLWGDAVNTASRMESHGAGGFVQVTEATYELIKYDFVCEPHGAVNVKGKGEMNVWYVLNRKP